MAGERNAADFVFKNLSDTTLIKLPGSINGCGSLTACIVMCIFTILLSLIASEHHEACA